jgi:hypothetical protein
MFLLWRVVEEVGNEVKAEGKTDEIGSRRRN